MRAVWLREFGPPEALVPGEAPDPVAAAGQVVVAAQHANITFVETQLRAGRSPFPLPPGAPPMIPGNGVGGRRRRDRNRSGRLAGRPPRDRVPRHRRQDPLAAL